MFYGDTECSDDADKADLFANFMQSVYNRAIPLKDILSHVMFFLKILSYCLMKMMFMMV
jgi:hypothetical protein